MNDFWEKAFVEPLGRLQEQVMSYVPNLIVLFVVLVVGLVLAWLVKRVLYHLLRGLGVDRLGERLGVAEIMQRVGTYRSTSYVLAQLVQGLLLLITFLLALNTLGPVGSDLLLRFFLFLPHLLTALLIVVVGGLAARFLARGTLIAAVNARLESARLLAGGVEVFIWLFTAVVALEHLGIGRTTLAVTFGIVFGGIVTGLAIAFGLAGKELARELLQSLLRREGRGSEPEGIHHL
jgi:hypothetical protein